MVEIDNKNTQAATPNAQVKKELTAYDLLEKFLEQQKLLIEKLDAVTGNPDEKKKKDKWDVISSLSGLFTFLSSIVIAFAGIYFTNTYKMQDVRITEAQTVEKFLPFLNSQNIETKKGALLAVYALQNYELAARLAASYAVPDNIEACEVILKTAKGEAREQLIDALVDALKTRAETETNNNNSRIDPEELIRNYNRIFELRNNASISEKRGRWYLASIYTGRGNIYRDLKKYKEASEDYNQSLKIYSDLSWGFENIGIMHGIQNNFELAIQNINKAIELHPNFGKYYADLGDVYARKADFENNANTKKTDFENAEVQYTKAIQKSPVNISLHFTRAYFFLDNEMLDKAKNAFEDIYYLSKDEGDRTEALYQLRKLDPEYSRTETQEKETQDKYLPSIPKATPKP